MNSKNIYGTIGYTILLNEITKKNTIILSDMHSSLPKCENRTNITDWLKDKFLTSKIFLEEVPRDDSELEELWSDSEHTQELKNLFLKNPTLIHPIDVRPKLIPFSWELLTKTNKNNNIPINYSMKKYMETIDNFYSLSNKYFSNKLPNYNVEKLKHTLLGKHFLKIKQTYKNFMIKNSELIEETVNSVLEKNINVLEEINDILSDIMEWYVCAQIIQNQNQSIIVHLGLAHSEKVIDWLENHYKYTKIHQTGINHMNKTAFEEISGCVHMPLHYDIQFGGFFSNYS
jgi:hypothetical protein